MKISEISADVADAVSDLTVEMENTKDLVVIRVLKDGSMRFRSTMGNKETYYALEVAKFDRLFDEKMEFKMKNLH
jgi:hypothetical protein